MGAPVNVSSGRTQTNLTRVCTVIVLVAIAVLGYLFLKDSGTFPTTKTILKNIKSEATDGTETKVINEKLDSVLAALKSVKETKEVAKEESLKPSEAPPKSVPVSEQTIAKIYPFKNGRIIEYRTAHLTFSKELLASLSNDDRVDKITLQLNRHDVGCSTHRRFGLTTDGGWDVCLVGPFAPKKPCTVLSFGINNDFSFDDDISKSLGCKVYAYDPTMKQEDYERSPLVKFFKKGVSSKKHVMPGIGNVDSLKNIIKDLDMEDKDIDVLKMDIEASEYASMEAAFQDGALKRVKQLGMEFHWSGNFPGVQETKRILDVLEGLYKAGFRMWNFNWNILGVYGSANTFRTKYTEVYFVNINYLK